MGINIDKFLDSFLDGEGENKEENIEEEKLIDLSFEEDIEKRLSGLQKQISPPNIGLSFLEEAFNEIKIFDETLPNKFIGIDSQAEITLKILGDKYSDNLFDKSKEQVEIAKNLIKQHLSESEEYKNQENLTQALISLEKTIDIYSKIPDSFFEDKQEISKEIKKTELNLLQYLNQYKATKLRKSKSDLNQKILQIKQNLKPGNLNIIRQEFEDLIIFFNSFPKIFTSDLFEEKEKLLRISAIIERYLEQEYLREFEEKEKIINTLTEEFLSNNIQKNFNQALLLYNQILVEFDTLPNVFFKKKVDLFKKINNLYTILSKLIIKNNVSLFVDSYNYSKIIEETREYLRHIRISKTYSKETLEMLYNKLNSIPIEIYPQIQQYIDIISNILYTSQNRKINNSKKNIDDKKQENSDEKNTTSFEKIQKNYNSNSTFNHLSQQNLSQHKTKKKQTEEEIRKQDLQKNILQEINLLYKVLLKSSDKEQIKIVYQKLLFYLSLLKIKKEEKEKIENKIKEVLGKKRLV